jgi:hypothetical protein
MSIKRLQALASAWQMPGKIQTRSGSRRLPIAPFNESPCVQAVPTAMEPLHAPALGASADLGEQFIAHMNIVQTLPVYLRD